MEQLEDVNFSWPPMEEQPALLWAPMEQPELSWAPTEQKELGLDGLLADRLASAAAVGLQMGDYPVRDDDAMVILQLLEAPRDEADLDEWLSGDLHSSPSWETNVNHQMEGRRSGPSGTRNFPSKKRGTRKRRMSPWMEDYPVCDDGAMVILQLLEAPQDEADLDEWLSGDLHSSPSRETNVNHQMDGRGSSPSATRNFPSNKRGTRKRRMSPWNPVFFEKMPSASVSRVCTPRKNNSRWTHEEMESLVDGISEYGVGRWTEVKGKYFSQSIRTSVNLKDKWRHLLKSYDVKVTSNKKKKGTENKTTASRTTIGQADQGASR